MTEYNKGSYAIKSFIAGGIAGCAAKTTTAPLDRFKILLQVHHDKYKRYGVWQGLYAVVKHEGFRGLYKGNGAMMVRVYPYAAVQFLSYEQYKKLTRPYFSKQHPHTNKLVSGSMAGITAVLSTYPLDLIRTRLAFQVDKIHYRGIGHAFVSIVRDEGGVFALYKGLVPTLLGMIPYAGIAFYTYERTKSSMLQSKYFTKYSLDNSGTIVLTIPANLCCGGLAGAVAQSCSYPLDVARRTMQLDSMQDRQSQNLISTIKYIFDRYGIKQGFYRGLSINFYRAIPQVAVSFTVYDFMKQVLKISKPL